VSGALVRTTRQRNRWAGEKSSVWVIRQGRQPGVIDASVPRMTDSAWKLGACHCGAVRFRVRPTSKLAFDCNCSICTKKGFLHLIVDAENFELESGRESLETYTFNTGTAKHHFCRHCGVHPFYVPRSHPNGFSVNLRCLAPEVIQEFSIEPFDGQNWEANAASIQT